MGRFDDRATRPQHGFLDVARMGLGILFAPGPKPATVPAPRRDNDGALLRELPSSLTWIGHACFAARLGGQFALIDPVWSDSLGPGASRLTPPGVALEKLPPVDVVLVTHNHRDHLDLATIKKLGRAPTYVVPLGHAAIMKKAGAEKIVELDWWQSHRLGELEVMLVPSRHWSMREPWNRNDMLWGGYVLKGPEGTAYHSGDTAFFDDFAEIGRRAGSIDWAMLPIGAYEPRWFMESQHMNPEEAGRAFELLGAKTFVAMHWGTFKLTTEPTNEPPDRIRRFFTEKGIAAERLWVMDVGETRPLHQGA